MSKDMDRYIIHVDMDAFFASIEMRDHPQWKNKPLVVSPDPRKNFGHGVVTTANYEARKYGIHSAMSAKEALRRCPQLIFCPVRKNYYREISSQIQEIFQSFTPYIEPIALDEAYLDVSHCCQSIKEAIHTARMIQYKIWEELQLTCSAGVSYNKTLAKLASDYQKPCGLTYITKEQAPQFLAQLPIEKFKGIGKKTLPKMKALGIHYGRDVLRYSEQEWIQNFGKFGYDLYQRVQGIDERPVEYQRKKQSIGTERTFHPPLLDEGMLQQTLRQLTERIEKELKDKEYYGNVLTLKWRYPNKKAQTRQIQFPHQIQEAQEMERVALQLAEEHLHLEEGIQLLGVSIGKLQIQSEEQLQLDLFGRR